MQAGTAATPVKPKHKTTSEEKSDLTLVEKERRHRFGTRL